MKKSQAVLTVFLILCAAAVGWFLPTVAAAISEQAVANTPQVLEISPVNVNASQELLLSDKYDRAASNAYGYALPKGVFLLDTEVKGIANDFLDDFMGNFREDLSQNSIRVEAHRALMLQSSEEAMFVAWQVDYPFAQLLIDDATGVILNAEIFLPMNFWDHYYQNAQSEQDLIERFLSAYNSHLQRQDSPVACTLLQLPEYHNGFPSSPARLQLEEPDKWQFVARFAISSFSGIAFNCDVSY